MLKNKEELNQMCNLQEGDTGWLTEDTDFLINANSII